MMQDNYYIDQQPQQYQPQVIIQSTTPNVYNDQYSIRFTKKYLISLNGIIRIVLTVCFVNCFIFFIFVFVFYL